MFSRLAGFSRSRRLHGLGARLGHVLQHFLLVGHIVLYHLDQVWDQVVAALELDVDLLPGVVHLVALPDQAVVEDNDTAHQQDDHRDDYPDYHNASFRRPRGKPLVI